MEGSLVLLQIPAFAGMTAGRREFGGENRAAVGEIPIYIGMVKNDGRWGRFRFLSEWKFSYVPLVVVAIIGRIFRFGRGGRNVCRVQLFCRPSKQEFRPHQQL